jgi:hypothetical protein
MDVLQFIRQMQEMYGDELIKPASELPRPQQALDREMFETAFKDKKADGGRIGFRDGLSAEVIKEKLPQYFESSGETKTGARKLLGARTIKNILNLYRNEKLGREAIAKKIPVAPTTIGRVLADAKAVGLIKQIPVKEMKASKDKITTVPGEKRKIVEVIRPVTDLDRKNKLYNVPEKATHKVFYYKPENPETSVIPKKYQGIQYYNSLEAAQKALDDKQNININQLKYKPQDNAVKSIHRIALQNFDDITDVKELSKMVYGNSNLKNLQNISNDLIRYQQVLLGFKDIKGLKVPTGEIFDNILSSFPAENEYGQFASGAIRNAKLEIRDKLLKTKGTKLVQLRNNVLKLIDSDALQLDEVMGVSATYDKAPGYTEFGQVIDKEINKKKGVEIDRPFVRLFEKVIAGEDNPTITYKGKTINVDQFNKISKDFAKKNKIETPTIVYGKEKTLDASKFIKNLDKLSPEAQKNIKDLAKKGVVLPTKALPISALVADLGCPKSLQKASGGRVKYSSGSSCAIKGRKVLEQGLKEGFEKGAQGDLARKILQAGKGLKDFASLRGLLGPAALSFLALEEAGYVGYDVLSKGKSFKEAIGDSTFNYLLGDRSKVDAIEERNKRMKEEGMTEEQMGKIAAYESALKEQDRVMDIYDKINQAEAGQSFQPTSDFSYLPDTTAKYKRQEDKARGDLREAFKTLPLIENVDYQGGAEALAEGLRRNELAQLRSVDNIFQSARGDAARDARKRELMLQNPDILNYMGPYPTTLGFARGGLSGGDTSGPPPEKGPMSQGLLSLYKNGRKL